MHFLTFKQSLLAKNQSNITDKRSAASFVVCKSDLSAVIIVILSAKCVK